MEKDTVMGLAGRRGEKKHGLMEMKSSSTSSSTSAALGENAGVHHHVLAVDDNSVDRTLIQRLLKCSAYQVTAVESAARALEVLGLNANGDTPNLVNTCQISLIITDYCMPGMSGYDLLKKLKESSTLKDIPVVIMSSENVHTRVQSCLAEGAHDFIFKPVKMADVERLREHLTSSSNPALPSTSSVSSLSLSSSPSPSLSSSSAASAAASLSSSPVPVCSKRKIVTESLGPTQTPRQRTHLEQVTVP